MRQAPGQLAHGSRVFGPQDSDLSLVATFGLRELALLSPPRAEMGHRPSQGNPSDASQQPYQPEAHRCLLK